MGNFIKTETSFADGEVSPNFFANPDIHGLSRLENMDIIPGGGLQRRPGLKKIAKLSSNARLVTFHVNETDHYVLAVMNGLVRIFSGDSFVQDVSAPWSAADIGMLQYAERFGTMIFVHPDYQPKILYRDNGIFKFMNFSFTSSDGGDNIDMPFMHFEDSDNISITITMSGGTAHLNTNQDFWTADSVDGHLSMLGKTWLITSYIGPREVTAACNGVFTIPNSPITDWQEAVFSPRRGWPSCITFHQNRLVFGGAKSWPGGVWMSCVGDHKNFNTGTGLDDQTIYFTLLSSRRQHICTMVSSDNLQILTSEGEWAVSNKPLTPESVNIKMHTTIGCAADRYLPPQEIDGSTIFISNNKRDIRQMVLDDLGEKYRADNLCALAEHIINNPIDIAYNKTDKKLFVVMSNGEMAVLNRNTALEISGWGHYTTSGEFKSVAVCDGTTYVVTKRDNDFMFERFDDSEKVDAEDNTYTSRACGLPIMTSGHNAKYIRIKKIVARVHDSKTLFINDFRIPFPDEVYVAGASGFSGDMSVNVLGTLRDVVDSPWEISTNDELPLTVLSITIYGRYQI